VEERLYSGEHEDMVSAAYPAFLVLASSGLGIALTARLAQVGCQPSGSWLEEERLHLAHLLMLIAHRMLVAHGLARLWKVVLGPWTPVKPAVDACRRTASGSSRDGRCTASTPASSRCCWCLM
jgi:hypothetical protein